MFKNGKFFGINIIDFTVVFFVVLAASGIFLVKMGKHITSAKAIEKYSNVEFDVVIRAQQLSGDLDVMKAGDKAFITIRNVPYTELEVVKSKREHWQVAIPSATNSSKAIAADDPTYPYCYNFLVTLKDKAVITKDSAVIGGNKIKIGLPVTIEGFNYRFNGLVSDVRVL